MMNTSAAIKAAQYQPAKVWQAKNGDYAVMSETTGDVHTVTKNGNRFTCTCPAMTGTCKHITPVIVRSMRAKGFSVVQIWTSETDARRQRRKTFTITRNGRQAWVTVGGKVEKPKPSLRIRYRAPNMRGLGFDKTITEVKLGDEDWRKPKKSTDWMGITKWAIDQGLRMTRRSSYNMTALRLTEELWEEAE